MEHTRYAIIGAGVSGLSFADWLGEADYLVFEASSSIGGYCKTVEQDGFTWDYSGHFFHFRKPEIERYLVSRMGDQKVLVVEKRSHIHYAGQAIDFPFQKNIHQLPKEDFVDCLVDLYFKEGRVGPSFEDMLYEKFGRGIAERFLIPYNEKLYATPLSRLDRDAMGRFFPYADVDEIIGNFREADNRSYNATFTYPEGGAIQYVEALAAGVRDDRIALEEPVRSIDLRRKVLRTDRREVGFDFLVSSAPFPSLLKMSAVPFDVDVYSSNKVLVFNLGFDRKGQEDAHWIYYPQPDLSFYRVGFYDNIFGTTRMSLYVEIGLPSHARVDEAFVRAQRERVLEDLEDVGVVDGHELLSHHHVVLDPAYVHITRDSLEDVREKKGLLATRGVYSIGRYGSWTYCSIEDNIIEARALADTFRAADELG